jgi:hypothetical protein
MTHATMNRQLRHPSLNVKSAADLHPGYGLGKSENEVILSHEVKRLSSKVAELNAQAMNEGKAVREMDTLYAEVQRLTDKLRQANAERNAAESRSAQEERSAKEAMIQRDAALRVQQATKLEAERATELASKLQQQMRELQGQLNEDWLQRSVLQRQIDVYAEETKRLADLQCMLDEERRCRDKLEQQNQEQQNLVATLREEFHARLLGDPERIAALGNSGLIMPEVRQQMTDDDSIEAFGEVLKKLIVSKSGLEASKTKRQLLFCFHPDKNPATEIATRITQILTSSDPEVTPRRPTKENPVVRRTSQGQARPAQHRYGSPLRAGPRYASCNVPAADTARPQSARPRCRV